MSASVHGYDPDILAAELGKLFGLTLTANMISRDGWNFESGPGDMGILKVELMKGVSTSHMHAVLARARIQTEPHIWNDPHVQLVDWKTCQHNTDGPDGYCTKCWTRGVVDGTVRGQR